jgi:hypothetical protein
MQSFTRTIERHAPGTRDLMACHNRLMLRASKTLLVLVLATLLPLRAVAGVVIGFCANGHQEAAAAAQVLHGGHDTPGAHGDHAAHGANGDHVAHAGHGHHPVGPHAGGGAQPEKPVTPTCSICAEHCSSAAFAPSGAPHALAVHAAAQAGPADNARAVPPHFPDQLDRPPLA